MKRFAAVAALLLAAAPLPARAADSLHALWDKVLREHTRDGWVDYRALQKGSADFHAYLTKIGVVRAAEEKSWKTEERLAFWINAYNAFTVKAVIDNYPIQRRGGLLALRYPAKSIRQIPGVWDYLTFEAAGRTVTLGDIEHKILRKELDEPRIHFAIVCASVGCPTLRNEAYLGSQLEEQLQDNIHEFIHSGRLKLDRREQAVSLSPILDWFKTDFARFDDGGWKAYPRAARGGLAFLSRYLDPSVSEALKQRPHEFSWQDYDWSLNDRPRKD